MPAAHPGRIVGYTGKGMLDEAIGEGERVLQLGMRADNVTGGLGCLYGLTGKKDTALQLLSGLEARSKVGYVSYFWVAAIHLGLGETDEAFAWFDKAYEERDGSLLYITVPTPLDALSPDPRYKQLLQKMGLEHLLKKLAPLKK